MDEEQQGWGVSSDAESCLGHERLWSEKVITEIQWPNYRSHWIYCIIFYKLPIWYMYIQYIHTNYLYVNTVVTIHITIYINAAAAKSLQSCPTLCDPIDGSPSGSPVPGILQARTREWVAISFANAWKWKVKVESLSRVRLLATPWTAAYQAPLSMGFSRQE